MGPCLAMHMDNVLLSPTVAVLTLALAGAGLILVSLRARKTFSAEKVPLMGVLGAFVFAAQMINFPLPLLGTSGHFVGAVLLSIVLGPSAATLVMAAILIVQCLIFQDGGLLALGCNIINMGFVPCFVGYAIYRLIARRPETSPGWQIFLGAWLASLLAVVAGATLVPLEVRLSGVLTIPTATFESAMILLHVPIGIVEGFITFAVLAYLYQASPQVLGLGSREGRKLVPGRRAVLATLLLAALVTGGAISWFASTISDGLETALTERYSHNSQPLREPSAMVTEADRFSQKTALLPDYGKRPAPLGQVQSSTPSSEQPAETKAWPRFSGWTSLAGVVGSAVTLGVVYLLAALLRRRQAPPRSESPTR